MATSTKYFLLFNGAAMRQIHGWIPTDGQTVVIEALSIKQAVQLVGGRLRYRDGHIVQFFKYKFKSDEQSEGDLVYQKGPVSLRQPKNATFPVELCIYEIPYIHEFSFVPQPV